MATDVERLIVRLEATQRQFERQLAAANATANRRARQIESRFAQMNRKLGQSFAGLGKRLLGGFAAGFAINELRKLADAATRIDNSLKVAGLSGAELERVYSRLRDAAIKNGAPLETLVQLYSRASMAAGNLGASQEDIIRFSENVTMALRVSGQSASEASGALLQLSQLLSGNVVQAQEYNSLIDGAYPILRAVAAGLKEAGGEVGKLTQIVKDGEMPTKAFFDAFQAGSVILEEQVASSERTFSQAFENLQTALIDSAREFDKATGASRNFATGIDAAARTINDFEVDTFIQKIKDAHDAFAGFFNDLGNAQIFKDLNELLGVTKDGELVNWEAEEAHQEISALEREVELLQKTIEKNTELGFDNSEALARLDEVLARLAAVRAAAANMPETVELDPLAIANRDKMIMASENARREALGAGKPPAEVKPVSLSDYTILIDNGGSGGGGGRGRGGGSSRPNDYEREVQRLRDRIALTQAMTAAQAELNPLVNDYGYSLERAATIVELENAAKRAGIQITPQLRAQIEELAGAYATATAEAARLAEEQDRVRQAADDMRELGKNVMGGFIQDIMNGVDATEALANALGKVADKLLEMALNSLFSGTGFRGGGLLGGVLIPGILHSGGVAGRDGYGHGRAVSPSVFTGAKRYHRGGVVGLQPGEVPAILQKGEVVLPKGTRAAAQGGAVDVRVAVDQNGNLQAYVERTAGRVSAKVVQSAAPGIVQASTQATQSASRDRPGFFR